MNNGDPFNQSGITGTDFNTYDIATGWVFDSRNRALFADRGSRQRLLLNTTFPGSDVEYYVLTYSARKFVPMSRYFTWSLNLDLRYGDSFGDTTSIPPFKNSFAGGPDTVRGFRENSLGPRDTFGNPYGGNMLAVGQAELIVPIPQSWASRSRFTVFLDMGNVFANDDVVYYDRSCLGTSLTPSCVPIKYDLDASGVKASYGLAAQWLSPMGLFRFSYAFPMNADEPTALRFGDETERFQFSIGGAF
jgi:outer membrane protein insertion porin family